MIKFYSPWRVWYSGYYNRLWPGGPGFNSQYSPQFIFFIDIMDTSEFIILCMSRVKDMLEKSLDGLTLEQTLIMPGEQSNNISWLAWHMIRGFDRRVSLVSEDDQLWITEKWYESYKLPKSFTTLGIGHSIDDVKSIVHSNTSVPVDYFDSVYKKMTVTLNRKETILYEKIVRETNNTFKYELMRMVAGTLQHVGQINYIRGLIENKIWYTGNVNEKR